MQLFAKQRKPAMRIYNHEAFWKEVFEFLLFLVIAFILSSFGSSLRKLTCFIQCCILFPWVGSRRRLALPLRWRHVRWPHHWCLGPQALLYVSARIHQPTCGKNFHICLKLLNVFNLRETHLSEVQPCGEDHKLSCLCGPTCSKVLSGCGGINSPTRNEYNNSSWADFVCKDLWLGILLV